MVVSYKNKELREYCSLLNKRQHTVFTSEEILTIRTIISELKAAPKLKEAPLSYKRITTNFDSVLYQIKINDILISFSPIPPLSINTERQITRIIIREIIRCDLQIVGSQVG